MEVNKSRRVFLFRSLPAVLSTVAFFDIGAAWRQSGGTFYSGTIASQLPPHDEFEREWNRLREAHNAIVRLRGQGRPVTYFDPAIVAAVFEA